MSKRKTASSWTEPWEMTDAELRADFIDWMEGGERMIHRLRTWSPGEIVWGWTVLSDGGSLGKTHQRDAHTMGAWTESLVSAMKGGQAEAVTPNVGIVWCGIVESVRTEGGGDPRDPEPPLKFAEYTDVAVYEISRYSE